MKRQKIRKFCMLVSLLMFPVTLYYFSPALIINAGLNGIINGSFIVFVLLFLFSIPFGRVFCAWLCPAGGLQECVFGINEKIPGQGWKNNIKYVIWFVWLAAVIFCYFQKGRIVKVDFFFETENGISVSSIQSYLIYYGIICLVFIPSVLFGKRVFCHYFCWMAPFMALGVRFRRFLHLPGLHVAARKKEECISCGKCRKVCPMGIDVVREVKNGSIGNFECIQCGACIDGCPKGVLGYDMNPNPGGKDKHNGSRKKT